MSRQIKRRWLTTGLALAAIGLLIVFPPFHLRPIGQARDTAQPPKFDPRSGASAFWSAHITDAGAHAIEAKVLAQALAAGDADGLGRRSSVGGEPFFLVKGTGMVAGVESRAVRLEIEGTKADVLLRVGPLFGNALRDAVESSEVAALSSFDANALSAELNKIAETTIQPQLMAAAKAGNVIAFVGVAQRREVPGDRFSIVVTPVQVRVVL